MAGPSAQNTRAKTNPVSQGTWPQDATQPPPLHPISTGGGYTPTQLPPLPIPTTNLQGIPKPKEVIVSIGKFSLLGIAFSLILFGAFTFLSGFLLGMWIMKPASSLVPPPFKEGSALEFLPAQPAQSQNKTIQQALIKSAGTATESAISDAQLADKVPEFLAPFTRNAQSAVGQYMGHKVEEGAENKLNEFSQPQPINSAGSPMMEQSYPLPSATTPQRSPVPFSSALPSPMSSPSKNTSLQEDGVYTIQLGVYAAKDNAHTLVSHLQALNYTSQITEGKAPDGSNLYYVHSGLYQNYNAALTAASQFASTIPGALVMKISSTKKSAS